MTSRAPQSLEENFVAYMAHDEGCVTTEAVIPPPDTCSESVHLMYGLAQWHVFTVVIVFIFALIIMQMIQMAIKDH
ncbi:hypothetical protein KJ611_01840 [Patescibacteria group bacterium]|nr:hypothetical protein [Patescibacteria group bacterium]MBU1705929.1 hypothetical protein [Patescibacteria group bacterium]